MFRSATSLRTHSTPASAVARRTAGHQARHLVVAPQRFGGGLALAERAQVRFHDVRQQGGADGPVGRGELAANRPGKAMHRAQPRIRQRQSAEQAGHRHIRSGGGVAAILKGRRATSARRGESLPRTAHRSSDWRGSKRKAR